MPDLICAAPIKWDPSLSTGVELLDEQHKGLFDCLNYLEEAAAEHSMLRTFYVLEQLSNYAYAHFSEEEFLMRIHDFPRLPDHIREHRSFTNRLHELRKLYLERDISVELVEMLKGWLKNHVSQTDMEYVPYMVPERRLELRGSLRGNAAEDRFRHLLAAGTA